MSLIYKSKGMAAEYSQYALNIYSGCTHNCKFCYNRLRARVDFFEVVYPLKKFSLKKLEKEAPAFAGKEVLLSFFSDAFQPIEYKEGLTYKTLEIFLKYGIIPNILTKGYVISKYWNLLNQFKKWKFGVSFSGDAKKERNCIPEEMRIYNLQWAKTLGAETWISFEPIIVPERIYELIKQCSPFTDEMRFGRWNYDVRANKINYKEVKENIINICKGLNQKCIFKKNLQNIK